ncbi:aminoglycoside phosphotransferase family protein [Streptomyces sp. NPDC090994]|uniref:aminoglycoside phosphotransferase family protein n=1 Tax=Streptomyces sp. NPDC090994 TaxID=3365969 RepID=UPI0037FFF0E7
MTTNPSAELLDNLLTATGQTTAVREEVRVWSMSGVECVTFPDGTTAIFKYAKKPFDSEAQALRLAHALGVPVPQVHASAVLDGWLGMLMENLGPSAREADDLDGVAAAVILHGTRTAPPLPVLDQQRLRTLPARALEHLERLRKADRWPDADDVADALDQIAQAAEARSAGATLEPFGWVHSEFHPTSLHIGERGWRLLDFARAFTGPGLLDLASWHGTIEPPHPVRLRIFLEQYVTAGGTPDALAPRGGLTAENWALGWHRMWAVEWFMEQAVRWIDDPATDPAYIKAVRRHLTDVLHLLEI